MNPKKLAAKILNTLGKGPSADIKAFSLNKKLTFMMLSLDIMWDSIPDEFIRGLRKIAGKGIGVEAYLNTETGKIVMILYKEKQIYIVKDDKKIEDMNGREPDVIFLSFIDGLYTHFQLVNI